MDEMWLAKHQWLEREVARGIQGLVAMSLQGRPAADCIERTLDIWLVALSVAQIDWNEELDADRVRNAFARLFLDCTEWPVPRMLIERMPSRAPRAALTKKVPPEELKKNREKMQVLMGLLSERKRFGDEEMARTKVPGAGTALNSWEDADKALAEIAMLNRSIQTLDTAQNEAIDRIKAQTKEKAAPHISRKEVLEEALKVFCDSRRSEFMDAKTKRLLFGSVGYRLTSRVVVKKVGDTMAALRDLGLTQFIRIKEELDKEGLRTLDSETLANVGASVRTENVFGYEVSEAVVEG